MKHSAIVITALLLSTATAHAEVRGQVDQQAIEGGFRRTSGSDTEDDEAEGEEQAEREGEEGEGDDERASERTRQTAERDESGDAPGERTGDAEDGEGWMVVGDDEDGGEGGEAPSRRPADRLRQREVDPNDPWVVRVDPWPLFELSVVGAPITRLFNVSIDRNVDAIAGRDRAHLETGYFGVVGFHLGVFPFARFDSRAIRGLGVEWSMLRGVGLSLEDLNGAEGKVEARYDELDFNLVYTGVVGRLDLGAHISGRLGWHRTNSFLGNMNNDLVTPFEYDALRVDVGVRVPLRTRHLLAEARGAYLFVPTPGPAATQAYGDGTDPTTHGAEVQVGLIVRAGGLELSAAYVGRWFTTTFHGVGFGFGENPSTQLSNGGGGIQPLEPAADSYQQIRLSLGYRW